MSAVGGDDLQNSLSASSESQTDQPAEPKVLPPFSGKLCVDEKLELRNGDFKQLIENYFNTNLTLLHQVHRKPAYPTPHVPVQFAPKANSPSTYGYFFKGNVLNPLSQLTTTPPFPTPHLLAQLANKTYTDHKKGETGAEYETRLALPDGWKLLTTASNTGKTNGYFGAAYWHPEHQQVVVAHRGTDPKNFGALLADLNGVLRNQYVGQMESASTFTHKVVEVLQHINRIKRVSFHLFFTGHSLGGWLAQITTFTTKYLKIKGNVFLGSINDECYHPHTVVFDSPGCKDMLLQLRGTFDVRLYGRSIDLEHLDITSDLSAPNRFNTCNEHVGTAYRIFIDLSDMGRWERNTELYTLATHSMAKIEHAFDPQTGQVHTDDGDKLKVQVVIDWPISTGLGGDKEYKKFFKWAKQFGNYHPDIADKCFQYSPIRYQTKLNDERVNSLSVFSEEEQEFLRCYAKLRQWPELCKPKELFFALNNNQAQEKAENILQNFEIESATVRCKDDSELQQLIPYVKRLLQLFPGMKDITNSVYQCETRRCTEQINQSSLEVNPEALSVREFLENEQQRLLQLNMVDGDEWTGLIKVYQVLQKNNCLIEGQYTVLKLEHFVSLNMLMDFRKLMQSNKAPHLIMVACEPNHLLKEETKDMIRTIFETMKRNPCVKIISATRSTVGAAHFLQHEGREMFGNGFVTRDEQLTWSDLTSSSQEKLLEKSVKFQGSKVSLNELMSAESPVAKFLSFGALLKKKELQIADPVPVSYGYHESYYIGRTFPIQKTIKEDIFNDKDVINSRVYLARSEQEYKQLSQMNPKSNVHWLEKDKAGNLLWQQSQGSLETVRRYIDTNSTHTYTDDDLVKLLEQAEHQRVMLISDTAGMGKSTVLTHLSKTIKQTSPTKWVVRIDLNDHTDVMKVLKQGRIDKEKAIEFVSEKLLKLKPGLEVELFKLCFEGRQKVRIVIMLDGFDEISPFYKETVIGLLQALRQTAIEQLWVTTRPHLREELEDKLQQLSYKLEPFSVENQVEFLTKYWSLKDWFTDMDNKKKEENKNKLEIYAKNLMTELGNSVSDRGREFTGIPLQTHMLAEVFDEEVKRIYDSGESIPQLPFKLDLLGLYGRFIERKCGIYQEEKCQVNVNNVGVMEQRERDLKLIRQEHQLRAMKVLFTEEQLALFQNNRECSFSPEELTRIGIVHVRHDGKPHFVHRTFAEYYVAEYLVNRLTKGNNTSQQEQTFILNNIFLDDDYKVIRVFIDGLLSRTKPSDEMLKHYGIRIRDVRNDCLLHRVALEGNANIITFLLHSARAGGHKGTVSRLLTGQDGRKRTAWYMAAMSGEMNVLQNIWHWAKNSLTEKRKTKMLLAPNKKGNTAWQSAAFWGNMELFHKILDLAKKDLTTEEVKDMLLATDSEGNTTWHWAAFWGKLDVLQKVWDLAKDILTTEEIKNKFLLAKNSRGKTAWHRVAESAEGDRLDILQKIWDLAKDSLTTEEIKIKLLLATDSEGYTAWHRAAFWGKLDVLQKIWDLAKEGLTTEEIKNKLLLARDGRGNTAWQSSAFWDNLDFFKKILDWAKENLTTEEIKNKLLLATDIKGNSAWHWAAFWGKLDLLHQIWDLAKDTLTTEEVKNKLLLATDCEGNTAWHWAAEGGKVDELQKLWDLAKDILTTEEFKNKLLLATNSRGNTAWHWAASWGKLDGMQKIWDLAKDSLTTGEIKHKLLLATDSKGNTAWQRAAVGSDLDLLQKIWDMAKDSLTTEEIKNELLLATDSNGNTAWHRASEWGKRDVLQKIWDLAKESLTTEEIKNKLLLATDSKGNTAWQRAAGEGRLNVLQKIWDFAKHVLTTEEIKNKLLSATDSKGNTTWQVASSRDNLDLFQEMMDWAKENLTTEEIKIRGFCHRQ